MAGKKTVAERQPRRFDRNLHLFHFVCVPFNETAVLAEHENVNHVATMGWKNCQRVLIELSDTRDLAGLCTAKYRRYHATNVLSIKSKESRTWRF